MKRTEATGIRHLFIYCLPVSNRTVAEWRAARHRHTGQTCQHTPCIRPIVLAEAGMAESNGIAAVCASASVFINSSASKWLVGERIKCAVRFKCERKCEINSRERKMSCETIRDRSWFRLQHILCGKCGSCRRSTTATGQSRRTHTHTHAAELHSHANLKAKMKTNFHVRMKFICNFIRCAHAQHTHTHTYGTPKHRPVTS